MFTFKSNFIGNSNFTCRKVNYFGKARIKRTILYSSISLAFVMMALFICPPFHYDDSNAMTGTPVASDTTLSISVDNDVLSLDLTPLSANGTFATTTTPATVYVTTNNITGYTLGIRTTSSTDTATKLVNNIDECVDTPTSTKCSLSTIDNAVSEEDYEATTSTDLNNTWGYLPSKYNSEINENYLPAPSTGELDILDITDAPSEIDTTNNTNELIPTEYTIDLGSRIDYTPYAGQYSGTLVITAVGNPVPYSVSYDANKPEQAPATANVDNMPTAQTGTVSSGDTIAVLLSQKVPTLGTQDTNSPTTNYTYAGYVFSGWCNVQPTEDPTTGYQTCPVQQENVTLFQPGDSYGIDQTVDNTQTLYAVWGAPATVTFSGNGLIYNDTPTDTQNTVQYISTYAGGIITGKKTNQIYSNTYLEPTPAPIIPPSNYIFKGWSTNSAATTPTYTNEQDIINNLNLNANDNITLYAVWTYFTIITFNSNGADGGETMDSITIEAGQTITLPQNTYTYTGRLFESWNTQQNGTGTDYPDQGSFTAPPESDNITLYAQWEPPCDANSICYFPNGANENENDPKMSAQTTNYNDNTDPIVSNMEVNLWPANYKYDTTGDGYNDYGFAGWSTDKNAASKILDTNPNNNPTIYGPNQNITLGDVSASGLRLYAVWMPIAKDSNGADLTLQTANLLNIPLSDDTNDTLANKPVNYVTALKDYRDNQVYAVAKLADENYWMIENLRLENSATVGNNINTPAITNESLAEGYNSSFIGLADAESANFLESTVSNSLYNVNNISGSSKGNRFPRYNNINTNTSTVTINMTTFDNNNNIYSLGNYYTWAAATADTTSHTDITSSLCPSGWHLPYGGSSDRGGFYYLTSQLSNDANIDNIDTSRLLRSFPNNFIYSGDFYNTSANSRNNYGFYWSANYSDGLRAYTLRLIKNMNNLDITFGAYKFNGYSVRCVIK